MNTANSFKIRMFSDFSQIVLDGMTVAISHAVGKVVNSYRAEIVDNGMAKPYEFFHVSVDGEHTEVHGGWSNRIVKSDLLTLKNIAVLERSLREYLEKNGVELSSITIMFMEEERRFGFSLLIRSKETEQ